MDRDEVLRTEIEDRIISKANNIEKKERSVDGVHIHFDMLDEFLDECRSLVQYFKTHVDTTIGVEVIRVYADLTRYFTFLMSQTDAKAVKENAQLWLDEINGWMDEIITYAAKNWEHLHPDG